MSSPCVTILVVCPAMLPISIPMLTLPLTIVPLSAPLKTESCFLWQHLASSFLQCSHTIAFKDSTLPSSVYFSVLQGGGVLNPQRWVREWHMTILHSFFPSSLEGSSFCIIPRNCMNIDLIYGRPPLSQDFCQS